MKLQNWKATKNQLFFNRNDEEDFRWGGFARSFPLIPDLNINSKNDNLNKTQIGIWGYADDEGIFLNSGRIGSQMAPETIRRFFYKMTPPLITNEQYLISDYGDWTKGQNLESQIKHISPLLSQKLSSHPMITLGGGHDYGAVDGAGFMQWHLQNTQSSQIKPLIINFDAHLDVRPWQKGLNSGTPFSWLLDHFPNQFEFLEVGIQKHCSSPMHHQWLQNKKVPILDLDFIRKVGIISALRQILAGTPVNQSCYISLDIDVFSQSSAPGCSQSWEAGLNFEEMEAALSWLLINKNVRLLGIYEVSPPLDFDHKTSKLAACMMDTYIKNCWTK